MDGVPVPGLVTVGSSVALDVPDGQVLSGSFVNYLLPGAMEVPSIKTVHLESPSPLNPLGVKGLGEGGAIAPPAAIANAVADALLPFTPRVNEIPLTPERVLELLAQRSRH